MAAFIEYAGLENTYPPLLVIVRESNGKYTFNVFSIF